MLQQKYEMLALRYHFNLQRRHGDGSTGMLANRMTWYPEERPPFIDKSGNVVATVPNSFFSKSANDATENHHTPRVFLDDPMWVGDCTWFDHSRYDFIVACEMIWRGGSDRGGTSERSLENKQLRDVWSALTGEYIDPKKLKDITVHKN